MKNSNLYSGEFACLEKANVDTDQIIPIQFLISISKTGLGPYLFDAALAVNMLFWLFRTME